MVARADSHYVSPAGLIDSAHSGERIGAVYLYSILISDSKFLILQADHAGFKITCRSANLFSRKPGNRE